MSSVEDTLAGRGRQGRSGRDVPGARVRARRALERLRAVPRGRAVLAGEVSCGARGLLKVIQNVHQKSQTSYQKINQSARRTSTRSSCLRGSSSSSSRFTSPLRWSPPRSAGSSSSLVVKCHYTGTRAYPAFTEHRVDHDRNHSLMSKK